MRIAEVAWLYEAIPPKGYGGAERMMWALTEELVRLGHDVTLFASGDSQTSARLRPACPIALRYARGVTDFKAPSRRMYEEVFADADSFDVIHVHSAFGEHFRFAEPHRAKTVTTLHLSLDLAEQKYKRINYKHFKKYQHLPMVALSRAHMKPLPWLNWQGFVHHGLPEDSFALQPEPGGYLAYLGRFDPEKRAERALRVAYDVKIKIKVAAKQEYDNPDYAREVIYPNLDHSLVEYVEEIGDREKQDFLGNALALLVTSDYEAFGIVLIEAMACGTPVIGWRRGAIPEVIEEGVTGFVVDDHLGAVRAVKRIGSLDRRRIRREFERRFTAPRMAANYVALYERLLAAA